MDHLTYQQTNNKVHKQYYDRFKKMVKENLNGDGWFLLVKDFPFRDGDNLMITMGEDIGKWKDKNLVSLYGKTKYIIGRCRKKGPVISLLDFQEGDYIKTATESGLRKELKEYFTGTGVSVRIYKSTKVSEPVPDRDQDGVEEEDIRPGNDPVDGLDNEQLEKIRAMDSPGEKRGAITEFLVQVLKQAQEAGITDQGKYNLHKNKLQRHVQAGKADKALEEISFIQQLIAEAPVNEKGSTSKEDAQEIREKIAKLQKEFQTHLSQISAMIQANEEEEEIQSHLARSQAILKTVTTKYIPQLKELE